MKLPLARLQFSEIQSEHHGETGERSEETSEQRSSQYAKKEGEILRRRLRPGHGWRREKGRCA